LRLTARAAFGRTKAARPDEASTTSLQLRQPFVVPRLALLYAGAERPLFEPLCGRLMSFHPSLRQTTTTSLSGHALSGRGGR
jgi:hypothetical protein